MTGPSTPVAQSCTRCPGECEECYGSGHATDPGACGDPEHCAQWMPCPHGCPQDPADDRSSDPDQLGEFAAIIDGAVAELAAMTGVPIDLLRHP